MSALLHVENLRTEFETDGGLVRAVDGVDLKLASGEVLGVVGESGSGKSVLSLSIMGLLPRRGMRHPTGSIWFDGKDILALQEHERRGIRGKKISMIFQDPMTALNPYLRIETQLAEVLQVHEGCSFADGRDRASALLERVGIADARRRLRSYPHEFSGGMRQRVMIAMSLLCKPKILIADEPTTALDVTVQAHVLALLSELRVEMGTSILFITHDLGVVRRVADRVAVMYGGRIVEQAGVSELFTNPRHPYTRALMACAPRFDVKANALSPLPGRPPNPAARPTGCAFRERCEQATAECAAATPLLEDVGSDHTVACFHADIGGTQQ